MQKNVQALQPGSKILWKMVVPSHVLSYMQYLLPSLHSKVNYKNSCLN